MRSDMLSKRLQTVAHMVTWGNRVCDVGCDHGYVSIYLVRQGISPGVLAMDLREGPLGAAREHVTEQRLEEKIELRLSNGLHNYNIGEADSLVCAGMGGRLMRRILEEDKEKTASFRELILQPQSELELFRRFLRESGYLVREEEMLKEDGKFYQVIRAVPAGKEEASVGMQGSAGRVWASSENDLPEDVLCRLEDRYGPVILHKKTPVFLSYLSWEERVYVEILDKLREQGLTDVKRKERYAEVEALLRDCHRVRDLTEGGLANGYDQD